MGTTIRHLVTSINGLLNNYSNKKLGNIFDMNGNEARKELELMKAKGDKYIGSDNCKTFDPVKGCQCHLK